MVVFSFALWTALAGISLVSSSPTNGTDVNIEKRQSSVYTYVNLATNTGASVHRASGILYGLPPTQGQIPTSFLTDFGLSYVSAGGAQDPAGSGWIYGGYTQRIKSIVSNYKTARSVNAQFILKLSDIWGADGTQTNTNAIWPGDNGSWTEYDRFLTQLVADLKANGMTTSIKILIWNEPDLGQAFWYPSRERFLDTWTHTYRFLKAALPSVPLAGPATAFSPEPNNAWWTAFLSRVKADNTPPDIYTWHHEGDINHVLDDLQTTQPGMVNLLNSYGLRVNEFLIDEYGVVAEQVPGGAAWWIARLERYNMWGMRGNWRSSAQLHDFMANVLGKSNINSPSGTGYYGSGEFQVYKYYATEMTGYRVATTGSGDRKMDSYAVVGNDRRVRILLGGRVVTGTYQLQIQNLSSLGLPTSGTLVVRTYQFNWAGTYGRVDSKQDLGTVSHTYSGNAVTLPIFQTDTVTTWAYEFSF